MLEHQRASVPSKDDLLKEPESRQLRPLIRLVAEAQQHAACGLNGVAFARAVSIRVDGDLADLAAVQLAEE